MSVLTWVYIGSKKKNFDIDFPAKLGHFKTLFYFHQKKYFFFSTNIWKNHKNSIFARCRLRLWNSKVENYYLRLPHWQQDQTRWAVHQHRSDQNSIIENNIFSIFFQFRSDGEKWSAQKVGGNKWWKNIRFVHRGHSGGGVGKNVTYKIPLIPCKRRVSVFTWVYIGSKKKKLWYRFSRQIGQF